MNARDKFDIDSITLNEKITEAEKRLNEFLNPKSSRFDWEGVVSLVNSDISSLGGIENFYNANISEFQGKVKLQVLDIFELKELLFQSNIEKLKARSICVEIVRRARAVQKIQDSEARKSSKASHK